METRMGNSTWTDKLGTLTTLRFDAGVRDTNASVAIQRIQSLLLLLAPSLRVLLMYLRSPSSLGVTASVVACAIV